MRRLDSRFQLDVILATLTTVRESVMRLALVTGGRCYALAGRRDPQGSGGATSSKALLVLILLASLVALVPMAHASPPDQLWIQGAYDADDLDHIVEAVNIPAARQKVVPLVGPPAISVEIALPVRPAGQPEARASDLPQSLVLSTPAARSPPAA